MEKPGTAAWFKPPKRRSARVCEPPSLLNTIPRPPIPASRRFLRPVLSASSLCRLGGYRRVTEPAGGPSS